MNKTLRDYVTARREANRLMYIWLEVAKTQKSVHFLRFMAATFKADTLFAQLAKEQK